ncbi:hypothetical protein VUR80DRAFT_2203 [Thermomyces stellatus]
MWFKGRNGIHTGRLPERDGLMIFEETFERVHLASQRYCTPGARVLPWLYRLPWRSKCSLMTRDPSLSSRPSMFPNLDWQDVCEKLIKQPG